MSNPFCGEITYTNSDDQPVHSDICWHRDTPIDSDYRKFIHTCLDEWLDKNNGTGYFALGDFQTQSV